MFLIIYSMRSCQTHARTPHDARTHARTHMLYLLEQFNLKTLGVNNKIWHSMYTNISPDNLRLSHTMIETAMGVWCDRFIAMDCDRFRLPIFERRVWPPMIRRWFGGTWGNFTLTLWVLFKLFADFRYSFVHVFTLAMYYLYSATHTSLWSKFITVILRKLWMNIWSSLT